MFRHAGRRQRYLVIDVSEEAQGRNPWSLLTRAGRNPAFLTTDHQIIVVTPDLALSDMAKVLGEDTATQHAEREERKDF